jgi:hypothetical protein
MSVFKSFQEAVKAELARGLAMPEALRSAKQKYPELYRRYVVHAGGKPEPGEQFN